MSNDNFSEIMRRSRGPHISGVCTWFLNSPGRGGCLRQSSRGVRGSRVFPGGVVVKSLVIHLGVLELRLIFCRSRYPGFFFHAPDFVTCRGGVTIHAAFQAVVTHTHAHICTHLICFPLRPTDSTFFFRFRRTQWCVCDYTSVMNRCDDGFQARRFHYRLALAVCLR